MALFGTGIDRSHVGTAPHLLNSIPTICNVVWKHLQSTGVVYFPTFGIWAVPVTGLGEQIVAEVSLCQLWAWALLSWKQSPFEQSWEMRDLMEQRQAVSMDVLPDQLESPSWPNSYHRHEETHLRPAQNAEPQNHGFCFKLLYLEAVCYMGKTN